MSRDRRGYSLESLERRLFFANVRVAVIGDYGWAGPAELSVAQMVKGWDTAATPLDAIVTTGDNNYGDGEWSTIDQNVGQYYADYIGDYKGSYGAGAGAGAASNKFYPVPGNHDWDSSVDHDGDGIRGLDPYLDYFTLPTASSGNERYYDVVVGPIHFFALDSDPLEPDGRSATSVQAQWLQQRLAASTAPWQVVLAHHSPYSSSSRHGSDSTMQWPFAQWGADAVLTGHDHLYERLSAGGIPYFINGSGGRELYAFGTPIAQSQVRYNADHGAQLIEASDTTLTLSFYNSGHFQSSSQLIDRLVLEKSPPSPPPPPSPPSPPPPQQLTATFRQGVSGYAGTSDTTVRSSSPSSAFGSATVVEVDGDTGSGQKAQGLLRFDNIFGGGAGQIPPGSAIVSAQLQLQVSSPGNRVNFHRLLRAWSGAETWNSLGAGLQADGMEASASGDAFFAPAATGLHSIDVTAAITAWLANPASNFGWALLPTGTNGVDFSSAETANAPHLTVTYNPPAPEPPPPPAWLAASPGAAYTFDGATLTVTTGTVTLTGDAGADNAAVSVIVGSSATVIFNVTQHLASLRLDPGSSATLAAGGEKVLLTRALDLNGEAWLDLNDNDLVLDYAAAAASPLGSWTGSGYGGVAGMVASAFNFNEWNGPGLRSSAAAASQGLTTLGIGEASDVLFLSAGETALWNGVVVDATCVIVKYTYIGDADLNGYVDAVDYGTVDNWIQFPAASSYGNGDFNFDGVIDAVDYGYLDNSIQLQAEPL